MKIFIPSDLKIKIDKKLLFILVRPFYSNTGWKLDKVQLNNWNLDSSIQLVTNIAKANLILIPYSINFYFNNGYFNYLSKYSYLCNKYNITAFGFIEGDFGIEYPEFQNIRYFRMSGFRSQLSNNNLGFPPALSDHYLRLFSSKKNNIRKKNRIPVVGFCGHANSSNKKKIIEVSLFIAENIKRFIKKPNRKDYESIFPSGYNRSLILENIKANQLIESNFVYRSKYRAGAKSDYEREKTTLEFYNNIFYSDYILCLRGRGNFSIRFYETLMMGRIPILIDTDCILPFIKHINWDDHVVWVNWENRNNIAKIIQKFHSNISSTSFEQKQINNRLLWKEKLRPNWIINNLLDYS